MSDHVFQDRKGQTFDQAVQRMLAWRIEVSGYEPERDPGYRYWWAVARTPDGEYKAIAGRVTNFAQDGWGYKLEEAHNYSALTNPPIKVRKALVSRGLHVAGVYEPGVTSEKFALMMQAELVETLIQAIKTKDDGYLLDAIASLKTSAVRAITEFLESTGSTIGKTAPVLSQSILDEAVLHLDEESGKNLMRLRIYQGYPLTLAQAEAAGKALDPVSRERLLSTY